MSGAFPIASRRKRVAAMLADALLDLIAPVLLRGTASSSLPSNPRVLLIRCDHIGDSAMAAAVLGPIREALGASRLDVLAAPWAAALFREHPAVDEVITVTTPWWMATRGASRRDRAKAWGPLYAVVRRIRDGHYDVGIDLRGDLRQILFFGSRTMR